MRRPFVDPDGYTHHCWECAHSCEWRAMRGWCEVYELSITRNNTPDDYLDKVAGCEYYERDEG